MDKVCLKWGGFEKNIRESFKELRENQNHFDVTLATDDDQQLQAHKIILSAGSNFFSKILTKSKHPSPFLYLKGIKMSELEKVVDFLYTGEANVVQEDLNAFLNTAEELQVRGLQTNCLPKIQTKRPDQLHNEPNVKTDYFKDDNILLPSKKDRTLDSLKEPTETYDDKEFSVVEDPVGTDTELDSQINQMLERSEEVWKCKVCGKRLMEQDIKVHVETHIKGQGLLFYCHICNKTTTTKRSLQSHISNNHNHSGSFICDVCRKSWVTRNAFNKHNRVYHRD